MLLNFDQFEQGSNLIVSIIFKLILTIQHDFGFLPPVLHVSVDNCWRENKVRYLLNVPIMCPDFSYYLEPVRTQLPCSIG